MGCLPSMRAGFGRQVRSMDGSILVAEEEIWCDTQPGIHSVAENLAWGIEGADRTVTREDRHAGRWGATLSPVLATVRGVWNSIRLPE